MSSSHGYLRTAILEGVAKLGEFRADQCDHPEYAGHDMQQHQYSHERYACPLFIHGGDVASVGMGKVWSKAVCVLSFGGLLCHGSDSHILAWLICNIIASRQEELTLIRFYEENLCGACIGFILGVGQPTRRRRRIHDRSAGDTQKQLVGKGLLWSVLVLAI